MLKKAAEHRLTVKSSRAFLLCILVVTFSVLAVEQAHAAGTLYLNPAKVAQSNVGSSFSVKIAVRSMSTWYGWQMQIVTDPSVINATGFTVNFPSPPLFEAVHCVNGSGSNCLSTDGPGIVDSAATFLGTPGPSNAVLFTINYTVVGPGPYSAIQITNDEFGDGSGGQVLGVVAISGQYGTPVKPDFGISVNPNSLTMGQNSSGTTTVTVSSIGPFTGTVVLSAITNETSLSLSLAPTSLLLSPGGSGNSALTISTSASTPFTSYSIIVKATNGTLTHSTPPISVGVTSSPYFVLGVSPGLLYIHDGNTSSTTVTVQSRFGFAGSVNLSAPVLSPAGLQVSLSDQVVTLQPDGSVNSTLTVVTPPSPIRFRYTINITGTSGSISRLIALIVVPPPGDVSLQINPGSFALQPGGSATATVTVSTHDYLWGTVDLSASMLGGTAKLNSTSIIFAPVGVTAGNFSLTLNMDPAATPGNYNLTLTVYTLCFTPSAQANNCAPGDKTLSHSLDFNVVVSSAQTSNRPTTSLLILGLAPLEYFGILGAFAAVFAVLAVQTVRKRREE